MMSSTAWARLILSPAMLHGSAVWRHAVESLGHCSGARRVVHSTDAILQSHCNCLSAHLVGIACAACPHVLQAHGGSGVRRLDNVRACLQNTQV
jgi:hypothetical protein